MQGQESSVVTGGYLPLTGLARVSILALNPSNAKLKELGYNIKEEAEEPQYVGVEIGSEDDKKVYTKLRFILRTTDNALSPKGELVPTNSLITLDFLISSRQDESSNGNVKYINDFGATAYSSTKDNPKMNWFWSKGNPRPAKEGEAFLMEFLRSYLNMDAKTAGVIKAWDKLVNGITSEIIGYIKPFIKTNYAHVLLGYKEAVKDNKPVYYQAVLNRCFEKGGSVNPQTKFKKFLENYQGSLLFQDSLELRQLDVDKLPKPDSNEQLDNNDPLKIWDNTSNNNFPQGEDSDPFA